MRARALLLFALAPLLGGCGHATIGSVAGGECKIFERPPYVVLGKRPYDQDWIDGTIEGGVGGCKWQRPAPRPAELDAGRPAAEVKPPAKRKGIIRRIRDKVVPVPRPWPAAAEPIAPAAVVDPPPPPPPPPPRSALDQLLHPSDR